jgi:hypothetical protein
MTKELKKIVNDFIHFEFENNDSSDYGSLTRSMFHSEYPNADCKYNRDFEFEVLAKAAELGLEVNHVDNYGGEDMGRDYWSIYSFTKDGETVYVKFAGWYASYHGSEYEECYFVEPKQVTVTEFERAK